MNTVEQWGMFECLVRGPQEGNPFLEHTVSATFWGGAEQVAVEGFYDGDGVYRVRFMPSFPGEYRYELRADFLPNPQNGRFWVTAPSPNNHGPVRVARQFHFAYADGTPYYSLGTTCYVWTLQSDARIAETLESLEDAGFNKIRFCILPKHYDYNLTEPRSYPFEGTPMDSSVLTPENFSDYNGKPAGNDFDYDRPNPAHFQHLERCIVELQKRGIEADLIVMHPYDRWGFSQMTPQQDDRYWKYVLARLSAFRNVWWSLANEYDLMAHKTMADWERIGQLIVEKDPYRHLCSVHNCLPHFDFTRPWVTHCSIQRQDLYKTSECVDEYRERYQKPVVMDEIAYEGNIPHGWGNITGEEMLRRFWEAACRGGYPGHGETMLHQDGMLWWSHGGKLRGESHKRMKFLLTVLQAVPGHGLRRLPAEWDSVCAVCDRMLPMDHTDYRLYYYSFMRPSFREFHLDDTAWYHAEVLDTWEMTITDAGTHRGKFRVELPGKPYMAIRIRKIKEENQ